MGWVVLALIVIWIIVVNLPDDWETWFNRSLFGKIAVGIMTVFFLLLMAAMCMGGGGWEARWG